MPQEKSPFSEQTSLTAEELLESRPQPINQIMQRPALVASLDIHFEEEKKEPPSVVVNHDTDYPLVSLPPFTPQESKTYLETEPPLEQTQVDAEKLVDNLEHITLLLALRIAYMKATGKTAEEFHLLYEKKESALPLLNTQYHAAFIIYQLALEQLESINKNAALLVKYCAYLHPKNINPDFLAELLAVNKTEFNACMHALQEYHLLSIGDSGLQIHPVVQDVIRYDEYDNFRINFFLQRIKPIMNIFSLYFSEKETEDPSIIRALIPHIETVTSHLLHLLPLLEEASTIRMAITTSMLTLYEAISQSNLYREEPRKQLEYIKKSFNLHLMIYGDDYSNRAADYNKLGNLYYRMGDRTNALDCYQKALLTGWRVYSNAHPEVARSYINLGLTYLLMGKINNGLHCYQEALAIHLQLYGEMHLDTALNYKLLGNLFAKLGSIQAARRNLEKALIIYHQLNEETHQADVECTLTKLPTHLDRTTEVTAVPATFFRFRSFIKTVPTTQEAKISHATLTL